MMASCEKLRNVLAARRFQWSRREPGESLAGAALHWVPSWILSVMLHALALLLLGLLISADPGGLRRNREFDSTIEPPTALVDATSLIASDHAGDPFTDVKSPNPPSLGFDPDEQLKLVGSPALPELVRFAPELSSPPAAGNLQLNRGRVSSGFVTGRLSAELTTPFAGRQGAARARLARREGGTVESERAVEAGLDWIVRHQRPDGSWSLNFQGECDPGSGCPAHTAIQSDTAATGLALLPLLGAGYIHTVKSRRQDSIRRGLEALVRHQQVNGDLYVGGGGTAYLYSHAIAAMALCEAYGLSRDPRLKKPAQRAVQFIANAQSPVDGGWRYTPGQPGDTSVFGWNVFALRSAAMAGLSVPRRAAKGCKAYLDLAAADPWGTTYSYMPGRPAMGPMTAEGLVGRQLLGWKRDHPPLIKGVAQVAVDLERNPTRNIYYWYYATQLLHNMKNQAWEVWNPRVREMLIGTQSQEGGCARGSWDPFQPTPDRWGRTGGRLFMTSLSILTLEVYYRYLPLYRDEVMDGGGAGDADDSSDPEQPANPAENAPALEAADARN